VAIEKKFMNIPKGLFQMRIFFKDGEIPIGHAGAIKKAIDKYGKNNR